MSNVALWIASHLERQVLGATVVTGARKLEASSVNAAASGSPIPASVVVLGAEAGTWAGEARPGSNCSKRSARSVRSRRVLKGGAKGGRVT
jgi:hypothetical protein